jgi:hypothetical protein
MKTENQIKECLNNLTFLYETIQENDLRSSLVKQSYFERMQLLEWILEK